MTNFFVVVKPLGLLEKPSKTAARETLFSFVEKLVWPSFFFAVASQLGLPDLARRLSMPGH
jgi:hypothetical protein